MESMASQAREAANPVAIMDKRTPPRIVETPAERKRTFSQCENSSGETTNPTSSSVSVADSVLTQVSTAPPASVPAPTQAPASVPASVPVQAPVQTPAPPSNSPMDEDITHSVSAHDSIDQQSIATSTLNQYPEVIVLDDDDDDDDDPHIHLYVKKESDEKKETYPRPDTQKKRSIIQKRHVQCKKIMEIDKEKKLLDEFEVDDEIIDLTPIMKDSKKKTSRYYDVHQMKINPEKIMTRSKSKQMSSSRSDYLIFPTPNETELCDNSRGRVEELPENDTGNITYTSMHQNFDQYSGPY